MINVTALEQGWLFIITLLSVIYICAAALYIVFIRRRLRTAFGIFIVPISLIIGIIVSYYFASMYTFSSWSILLPNGTIYVLNHTSTYLEIADRSVLGMFYSMMLSVFMIVGFMLYDLVNILMRRLAG